jgi:hypothetical protein
VNVGSKLPMLAAKGKARAGGQGFFSFTLILRIAG